MRREAVAHRLMSERHDLGEKEDRHVVHAQLVVASWMLQTCEAKKDKESAAGRSRAQQAKVAHQREASKARAHLMRGFGPVEMRRARLHVVMARAPPALSPTAIIGDLA